MKNSSLLAIVLSGFSFLLSGANNEGYTILHNPKSGQPMAYSALRGDTRKVVVPKTYHPKSREFRGIWVATYAGLDFPVTNSPYAFQQTYRKLLQNIRSAGFNAVFFQIRPSCDAFYNSVIQPFSKTIRGQEGSGYTQIDMLRFMIDEAHRNGLEFHAWMNPYRVVGKTALPKQSYLKTLSAKNFARQHPECVLCVPQQGGYTMLLDPGMPLVRQHLLLTVREIVEKYTPDSIVFDDYFYPYNYEGKEDLATWKRYNPQHMALAAWRRNNINMLIRDVSTQIRQTNRAKRKNIRFGISPFGIWLNSKTSANGSPTLGLESYKSNFSDTLNWMYKRWIDYVVPQLYWQFDTPKAPYACLADWWADKADKAKVTLYIGIGVHQQFSTVNTAELKNQILYNQRRREISGAVFYSYNRIFKPNSKTRQEAVRKVIQDCWKARLP